VVFLPAGQYLIDEDLTGGARLGLKSRVVLRGAGRDQTTVTIRTGASFGQSGSPVFCDRAGIHFCGGWLPPRAVTSGLSRGSAELTLADTSDIDVGDYLLIYQDDNTDPPPYIDNPPVGNARVYTTYVARVVARWGSRLVIDRPLRHALDPAFHPTVRPLDPVEGAGLEDLKVELTSDSTDFFQPLVRFERAVNSWVRNAELFRGYRYAVLMRFGGRNTVQDTYIHRLLWYEFNLVGWNGYGITFAEGGHDNLIVNNVISDMPITLMLQGGASGNVVAYNYLRSDTCSHGIFFHGWYPHSNLIEGNDSDCRITLDNFWGRQGPWNTLFRNRVGSWAGSGQAMPGIRTHQDEPFLISSYLNVLGNIARGFWRAPACTPPFCWDFDERSVHLWGEKNLYAEVFNNATPEPTSTFIDMVQGTQAPPEWAGFQLPASLYLRARPDFWPAAKPWPGIGADVDVFDSPLLTSLPAQDWFEGSLVLDPPDGVNAPSAPVVLD
jgi:hypothetical protein